MGKEYETGDRELASCGTEALFGGRYGGLVGLGRFEPEYDMCDFALGALVTAGRRG